MAPPWGEEGPKSIFIIDHIYLALEMSLTKLLIPVHEATLEASNVSNACMHACSPLPPGEV